MSVSKNEGLLSSVSNDSFYDTSEEAAFSLGSPDSGVHDLSQMTPEAKAKAQEEWTRELAKTEEEINTLRQVLSDKIRKMHDLKRKLGITVWKEFKDDMEQGIRNLQETTAYQKTSQTLKTASEKTSEALGTFGATVTKKLEEVKQSQAFKSLEEKVGSAYSNVKTKVSGTSINQMDASGIKGEPLIEKTNESQIPAEKS
ncbi:tumor protein D52 [Trichonephila inaurata madagascariensis]|uniref:Tumor protein D52 n=1 Tax=Trichonephila inaurata madagascariensis TaxID=2747483 RepID=A0A8X7CPS4_9ARAC|nr:tumor protein D52 [Trichonephila inaurata madagascariensis]